MGQYKPNFFRQKHDGLYNSRYKSNSNSDNSQNLSMSSFNREDVSNNSSNMSSAFNLNYFKHSPDSIPSPVSQQKGNVSRFVSLKRYFDSLIPVSRMLSCES